MEQAMAIVRNRVTGTLWLKCLIVVGLVALGDRLFYQNGSYGGAFGLYGLALAAGTALAHPACLRNKGALLALLLAAGFAIAMAISPSVLALALFLVAIAMATLLPRTARFGDGWRWMQRLAVNGLFAMPGPLPDLLRRSRVAARRRTNASLTWHRLAAICALPLVGSIVFGALFAMANPVIGEWLHELQLPKLSLGTIGRMILWAFLLWLAWALMRPFHLRRTFGLFDGSGDLALPGISSQSVLLSLLAFNGLFLLQNGMDAAWLWGLAPLPEGITLASYAHRGAYPLVVTALLAALFVLVALRPGSTTAGIPAVRRLVALWVGQNLFLLANAALRTLDYVDAYSLTRLRIAALLWMGLVAVGLALVLWRMLAGKSVAWLLNCNLVAAGLLLGAVSFVDLGAIAAQWNVRHAREVDGTGAGIDLCYLHQLEGSALLPLVELEQHRLPPDLAVRVRNVRIMVQAGVARRLADGGWDWLSARRLAAAEQMLGGKTDLAGGYRQFTCHGEPYELAVTAPALPEARDAKLTGRAER